MAEATKRLLLPMSHHLENRAMRIGEGAVILSVFQDAHHFTPATVRKNNPLWFGTRKETAWVAQMNPEASGLVNWMPLFSTLVTRAGRLFPSANQRVRS